MTRPFRTTFSAAGLAAAFLLAAASPLRAEDPPYDKPDPKAADKAKESKEALERAANEQFTKVDKNNDGAARGDELPEGWAARFDKNGDGAVQRGEFVEIMSRPEKLRRLHPMRDARARAADALKSFDQDKNGQVERAEYPGRDDAFRNADRNNDEILSTKELLALAEEELEGIRKTMQKPSRYEFLVVFDVDKNNNVTADEYDGSPANFRKFDLDKDGVVSYAELYPERMAAMAENQPKPEDKNAIETMDADKDGKVSRAEFKGSDAAWARMDRNGDGFVTTADGR